MLTFFNSQTRARWLSNLARMSDWFRYSPEVRRIPSWMGKSVVCCCLWITRVSCRSRARWFSRDTGYYTRNPICCQRRFGSRTWQSTSILSPRLLHQSSRRLRRSRRWSRGLQRSTSLIYLKTRKQVRCDSQGRPGKNKNCHPKMK